MAKYLYQVKVDLGNNPVKVEAVKKALDLIIKKHLNLTEVAVEEPQQLIWSDIEEYE